MDKLTVLIVDDSVLYRRILANILADFTEVEVLGSAHSGKMALDKIRRLQPDVVTLDFEMPEMDGIQTLREIKKIDPYVQAVMISSHSESSVNSTVNAVEHGAFDFIEKPDSHDLVENKKYLYRQLKPIINVLVVKKNLQGGKRRKKGVQPVTAFSRREILGKKTEPVNEIRRRLRHIARGKCKVVALAISTGGPNALAKVIPQLPGNLRVPVLIVQHMPPVFTKALATSLENKSSVTVVEAQNNMEIKPATVYIAPGGKQMKVVSRDGSKFIRITDDPPVNNCRPSADYLFESVAEHYKDEALGVIMTGMGADGVRGLIEMNKHGVKIIAQDAKTCTVFGMPMEAIKAGVVDVVCPLDNIAEEIINSVR